MVTHFFVTAIVILNGLDAVFTVAWVEAGLAVEANPLMAGALAASPALFVLAKVALVNAGAFLLWQLRRHSGARAGAAMCASVYYALLLFHLQYAGGLAGYYLAGFVG
jgi:hypothetical protein